MKGKTIEGSSINVSFSATYFELVFLLFSLTVFVSTLICPIMRMTNAFFYHIITVYSMNNEISVT